MKRLICICLLLSLFLLPSCAVRVVPQYPDTAIAIKSVAESNMPPEQKSAAIAKIQDSAVSMYDKAVEAWQKQGLNWIQALQIAIGFISSGTAIYFGARVSK
jgi:hypothetical protein